MCYAFHNPKQQREKGRISMAKRTGLFRALTFIMAFLVAVSSILGVMLETFRAQVDETLGTRSQMVVTAADGTAWSAFTPPAELLKANGHLDTQKTIQHFMAFGRELGASSCVLLKNNGALPLQKGNSVTLLGMRGRYPILASGQGMPIVGPIITLEDALSKNRTDFRNPDRNVWRNNIKPDYSTLDDFSYAGGEMKVNPTPLAAYEAFNKQFSGYAAYTYIPAMMAFSMGSETHFDDPSLEELKALAPDFESSFADYRDAAIVVVGRPSSENGDYQVGGVIEGRGNSEPLELTANERDIIRTATENFDKVIVLVNAANTMEIQELQNNDKIDAILWIGHPGAFGMLGVYDVLVGDANPSGGLPDTYAVKNLSAPAMVNFGNYTFANFNTSDMESGAEFLSGHNLHASACGYLFKRNIIGRLRFTPGICHEDEEFTPQLLLRAETVSSTDAEAYFYRHRPHSITTETDKRKVVKRLNDKLQVICRLNHIADTLPTTERIALGRRVAQLTMDFIYNVIVQTNNRHFLDRKLDELRRKGLFPLPDQEYTAKYKWFRRLTNSKTGLALLMKVLPMTARKQ